MIKISPLAPDKFPDMPPIKGVRLAAVSAGIRYSGRADLMLAELAHGTAAAGVFTLSKTASAPVEWCRRALKGGLASALLVNSGNANAFNGIKGVQAVERTVKAVADLFPCRPSTVFTASTGVIGEVLADEKITGSLAALKEKLDAGSWQDAARAIMTTDTYPKGATTAAVIGGVTVSINAIAKGSGMIAPDMATMLGFVFTDAAIPAGVLQELLSAAADKSFNCITVDSDTSTSDTLMLFATGRAEHAEITSISDPALDDFKVKLEALLCGLAQQVVRDGEGASKFITIAISGAEDDKAARRIGLSVANSPLVKTAVAGGDANWGRIVMAVGKAGEAADRDKLAISIGGVEIAAEGAVVAGYDEAPVAEHMSGDAIDIAVDVGVGGGRATVWTCDLTHGYIEINADYRT